MINLVRNSDNIFSGVPCINNIPTCDSDSRIATAWLKRDHGGDLVQDVQSYWYRLQTQERLVENPDYGEIYLSFGIIPNIQRKLPLPEPTKNQRLTGPIQFILGLLNCWKLDRKDAVCLLGFEETQAEIVSEMIAGNVELRGRDAKERLLHLLSIRESLHYFFQNLETENDWLREPQPLLDGQTPVNLLLEGSMGNILLVREYVDSMVGR